MDSKSAEKSLVYLIDASKMEKEGLDVEEDFGEYEIIQIFGKKLYVLQEPVDEKEYLDFANIIQVYEECNCIVTTFEM